LCFSLGHEEISCNLPEEEICEKQTKGKSYCAQGAPPRNKGISGTKKYVLIENGPHFYDSEIISIYKRTCFGEMRVVNWPYVDGPKNALSFFGALFYRQAFVENNLV